MLVLLYLGVCTIKCITSHNQHFTVKLNRIEAIKMDKNKLPRQEDEDYSTWKGIETTLGSPVSPWGIESSLSSTDSRILGLDWTLGKSWKHHSTYTQRIYIYTHIYTFMQLRTCIYEYIVPEREELIRRSQRGRRGSTGRRRTLTLNWTWAPQIFFLWNSFMRRICKICVFYDRFLISRCCFQFLSLSLSLSLSVIT